MRNLDIEFKDNELRKYQYSFDGVIRMKLLERWLPRLQQNQPSLEMGSFDGSMTELLAEQLSDLEVVEGSGELAQVVREKLPNLARVNHSMFEEFSPARLFQQIFLVHGLEHLENPVEVLKASAEWLSETGLLFVAVPNATALSRLIAVEMGLIAHPEDVTEGEKLHGHQVTYTQRSLRKDLELAGLEIVEEGGVILKTLANFQFDAAMSSGVISDEYITACEKLSREFPGLSSSIYAVVRRGQSWPHPGA